MLAPPPQGDPAQLLAPGQTNPEAYMCLIAWEQYKVLAGTVVDQAVTDMLNMQAFAV